MNMSGYGSESAGYKPAHGGHAGVVRSGNFGGGNKPAEWRIETRTPGDPKWWRCQFVINFEGVAYSARPNSRAEARAYIKARRATDAQSRRVYPYRIVKVESDA
jgi:hypothetical protein